MVDVNWFWLSFCDTAKPAGQQFLGGCYVPGNDMIEAVKNAWDLGCNPGGQVAALGPFPESHLREHVPEENWSRLLSRAEIPDGQTVAEIEAEQAEEL
jgi:hypothetical protein